MNRSSEHDFDVDALLREATSVTLPEQTEARLQTQLDDFRKRMAPRREGGRFAEWLKTLPRWVTVATVAPVLVLIVVGIVCLTGNRVAFAEVLERFRSVRTIKFVMSFESNGIPTEPVSVAVLEPGKARELITAGMTVITDAVAGKSLLLDSAHKSAVMIDRGPSEKLGAGDYIERLREAKSGSEEKLGEREMDGHKVAGFRISREGLMYTIWADAKTEMPVRVMVSGAALGEGGSYVLRDFVFNEPVDESQFSLTPPEGYSVQQSNLVPGTTVPSEKDVVDALRSCAKLMGGDLLPELNLPAFGLQVEAHYGSQDTTMVTAEMVQAGVGVSRAAAFVQSLKGENDWHYAGGGVKLGEAAKPVCWWKPAGASRYRVIYGDLTIRDETAAPSAPLPEKPMTFSTPEGELTLKPSTSPFSNWTQPKAGQVHAVGMSLKSLFCMAYEIGDVTINAALPRERYDLTVQIPEGRAPAIPALLRVALQEKFKYSVHYETHEESGYAITSSNGPGPRLRKSTGAQKDRHYCVCNPGKLEVIGQEVGILGVVSQYLKAPLLDKTGLAGTYDFTLTWDPRKAPESIVAALRDQLGLEVTRSAVPVRTLIVDPPEKW